MKNRTKKRKRRIAWLLSLAMVMSLLAGVAMIPETKVAKADQSDPEFGFRFPTWNNENRKRIVDNIFYAKGKDNDNNDADPTTAVYLVPDSEHEGCFNTVVDPAGDPDNWKLKWDVTDWKKIGDQKKINITLNGLTMNLTGEEMKDKNYDTNNAEETKSLDSCYMHVFDAWNADNGKTFQNVEFTINGTNSIISGGSTVFVTKGNVSFKKGSGSEHQVPYEANLLNLQNYSFPYFPYRKIIY